MKVFIYFITFGSTVYVSSLPGAFLMVIFRRTLRSPIILIDHKLVSGDRENDGYCHDDDEKRGWLNRHAPDS